MALTDNLVSFWELGEASGTRNDSHGTNHLTDNDTVGQTTGIVGNAALFNGTSEYLSRADNASLSPTGAFTLTGWYFGTALAGSNHAMISKEGANFSYYLFYPDAISKFRWRVSADGSGTVTVDSSVTPSINTWYFVVVYYNGSVIGISVNDVLTTTAHTTGIFDSTDDFVIGAKTFDSEFWTGTIDQVGLWSRAISSAEITQLYNASAGLSYAEMVAGGAATILQSGYVGTQIVQY